MKVVSAMLFLTCLSGIAHATDWTPHLKPIQHNCNYLNIQDIFKKPLPKSLQASLSKRQGKISSHQGKISLTLRHAKAFGKPLTRIDYQQFDANSSILTLHFGKDMMELLPKFTFGDTVNTWQAGQPKAWITFLAHTNHPKPKILTNKSYPIAYTAYKQANYLGEFWDKEAQKLPKYAEFTSDDAYTNQTKQYRRYAYTTDKTGYTTYPIADADVSAVLKFDSAKKTVSCRLSLIA